MDWTLKTPYPWEWETWPRSREKELANLKPAQQPEWNSDDGHFSSSYGNDNGSVYSPGGGACSGSDLGTGSSKSSISISTGSPSKVWTRVTESIFDPVEQPLESPKQNENLVRVETESLHGVVAIGETQKPLIALKIGKKAYFEDVSGGSNITNSSSFASMNSSIGLMKKPKFMKQNMQNSNCQVEGCNADLTTCKDYHRKHKVCESHSKSPGVIVDGQHCRFCQQCSRFHNLCEFDQNKRSCRRRLIEHNARRRKQQPETISFGSSVLPISCYGDRQATNIMFRQDPFSQIKNMASSTGTNSGCFNMILTKRCCVNSSNSGVNNGHLHYFNTGISRDISMSHDSNRLLPLKGMNAEVFNKGLGEPVFATNFYGAPDPPRAFSLLSTESSSPSNVESTSDCQFVNANSVLLHSAIHPTNAASHILQQDELPVKGALPFSLQPDGSHLHKIAPYETHFLYSQYRH